MAAAPSFPPILFDAPLGGTLPDDPNHQTDPVGPPGTAPRPPTPPGRPAVDRLGFDRLIDLAHERGITPSRAFGSVAALVVIAALGWWLLRPPAPPVEVSLPVETSAPGSPENATIGPTEEAATGGAGGSPSTSAPSAVVAHAAGAVARPGLYRLRPGARVADLVDAAGGLAAAADGNRLNLAAPLVDGERVYVLGVGEAEAPLPVSGDGAPIAAPAAGGVAADGSIPSGPIDLNTADLAQLDTLPGVGPATAQAIVDHRTEHGRFNSVDELLDVRGIGEAKLAELRDRVTV